MTEVYENPQDRLTALVAATVAVIDVMDENLPRGDIALTSDEMAEMILALAKNSFNFAKIMRENLDLFCPEEYKEIQSEINAQKKLQLN